MAGARERANVRTDAEGSRLHRQITEQRTQQRRPAGPQPSGDAEYLSRLDREADVPQGTNRQASDDSGRCTVYRQRGWPVGSRDRPAGNQIDDILLGRRRDVECAYSFAVA